MATEMMKDCFAKAGYQAHHEVDKVIEYSSPTSKRWVYLRKDYARRGSMRIVLDPCVNSEELFTLDGVARPKNGIQHGPNMRRFPKRLNRGKQEIHYGTPVDLVTIDGLARALRRYDAL